MKKLKLNSTLNHKHDHYSPYEVIVEKVVTLYGKSFEKLKNNPSQGNRMKKSQKYVIID